MRLYWVLYHGTFLTNCWKQESGVNLYHCASDGRGFFVEAGIDALASAKARKTIERSRGGFADVGAGFGGHLKVGEGLV